MTKDLRKLRPPRSGLIAIDYTNHRGERSVRPILPKSVMFGSNEWHPEPQWLMEALDINKGADRSFAMLSIHAFVPYEELKEN